MGGVVTGQQSRGQTVSALIGCKFADVRAFFLCSPSCQAPAEVKYSFHLTQQKIHFAKLVEGVLWYS